MTRPISRPASAPLLFHPMPVSSADHITYIPTPDHHHHQHRLSPFSLSCHLPSTPSTHQLRMKYGTQTRLLTALGIIAIVLIIITTWILIPTHDASTDAGANQISTTTTTTSTPSQTPDNNTSMQKSMRFGVILSMWGPPDLGCLSRFLRSMHVSIPPSDLIGNITLILVVGMNDEIRDIHHFKSMWEYTIDILKTIHSSIVLSYYGLKKVNDGRTDARDLIFQADPFELFLVMIEQRKLMNLPLDKHLLGEPLLSAVDHLAPDDPARSDPIAYRQHLLSSQHILFAWESQTIAESSWNTRVIRNGYGVTELNKIQHEMISCSGTIIGHVDLVMRYCQQLYLHGLTAEDREMFGLDQSSHMHLLYTDWINLEHQVMLTDYNDGIIHTIGVLAPNQVHVDQFGRIRDGEGHLPAIVHQFDRFPELVRIIEGQYPYRPDGYPITKTLIDTNQGVHAPDPPASTSN